MGCWYKTCGLSNLHIIAGTPVYVFLLEEAFREGDRCYSTAFCTPLLLPFESTYNDYGGGEDSHGAGFEYIMAGIRKALVECEVGENEYHDIAVKRDGFGENEFFESVHEHRLKIGTYDGENFIDFVMMRKDIVDDVLENLVQEKYVGGGKGTGGYGNNYDYYKFADVLADIPAFLDKTQECIKPSDEDINRYAAAGIPIDSVKELISLWCRLEDVFAWGDTNKVGWYMHRDTYRVSSIVRVHELIISLMHEGKRVDAEAILKDHLKAVYINEFMERTRKLWMPGGHEGSQSNDHDGYRALMAAMDRALIAEQAEYDEENCDEDEDE